MHLLITGICGFAGSVIARGLLEHLPGIRITGIDSLIRKGSETNLEPLRALGIDVRVGDIRNEQDLADLPAVDWVLDCAANPSVLAGVDGQTSAKELLDHNLGGTIYLLEYCRKHKAGFILLSTSRVYSIPPLVSLPVEIHKNAYRPVFSDTRPSDSVSASSFQVSGFNSHASSTSPRLSTLDSRPALSPSGLTEHFSTLPPISLYGSSKKCSELLALEYGMTFDFPVRINRCGVLAGAGQFGKADQGIFSFWIHSWARRRSLKYIGFGGGGYQVRDCLHPRDIVPLLIAQMKDPGRRVEPILNVSGGVESAMSLAQLSAWCADRLGTHQVAADTNPRPFDIPWMVLDSSVVKQAWDWKPQTLMPEILEEIAIHAEGNPEWIKLVS
jgi:CDP-paratose 2-epimerase